MAVKRIFIFLFFCMGSYKLLAQQIKWTTVANGWAANSVNAVVFRKNSLITNKDTQYVAYYDQDGFVVVGKRPVNKELWQLQKTVFKGNVKDAHNAISIIIDGDGYLHISWDHHNNALRYAKSVAPGSLDLSEMLPMTGNLEQRVTYPEFFVLPNGNLLFFYRNGGSGNGDLVINGYNISTKSWSRLHNSLIDGEGKQNAYWQSYVDRQGVIHISWVWRGSPDVASNQDMCYARSVDGGITWEKSSGEKYQLPITVASAEYVCRIPQKSELINQTSMFAMGKEVFIATYFRNQSSDIPQYQLIYFDGKRWKSYTTGFRTQPFSLSGGGTKRIPIARPQIVAWKNKRRTQVALIYRDIERGSKVTIATTGNVKRNKWVLKDYSDTVGAWEPSYDTELWKYKHRLDLFVQHVEQADGEGSTTFPAQEIKVLEVKFK